MDLDNYQFNINKYELIQNNETKELVRDMFSQMISFYQDASIQSGGGGGAGAGSNIKSNAWYKSAQLLFNTLMNNGYLISERERKLGEILDDESTSAK